MLPSLCVYDGRIQHHDAAFIQADPDMLLSNAAAVHSAPAKLLTTILSNHMEHTFGQPEIMGPQMAEGKLASAQTHGGVAVPYCRAR